ncbi:60S ribosomal protein L35a-4 [Iris pallida]|uniref:60S ribosomal protein L35a-4 n=1 Tax=Iris pallida TaxID=29817 RepID=A0AAX6HBA7_IRIPA|nr:60S ribosomal protein L35a-4 [Iris pallida]
MVRREESGLRLQGQGEEGRVPLPLHLGQGHPPPREQWGRQGQVQVQPPAQVHGSQSQGFHVPKQHLINARCSLELGEGRFSLVKNEKSSALFICSGCQIWLTTI